MHTLRAGSCIGVCLTLAFSALPMVALAEEQGPPEDEVGIDSDEPEEVGSEPVAMQDIVVTATRRNQSKAEASVPVDRIDAARMSEIMPVTVADVASESPGVELISPAGVFFRNPSIRGLGGRRVVMLVDGQRIDTEKTVGVTGYFVDVGNLDRVEVLRGPGSVLYGSDALGGVINMLTVSPLDQRGLLARSRTTVASNNGEIGNWSTLGWSDGSWGLRLSTVAREAGNYRTGDGEVIGNSYYEDRGLTVDAARRFGGGHTLRLQASLYEASPIGKAVSPDDDDKLRRIHFPEDRHDSLQISYEALDLSSTVLRVAMAVFASRTMREQRAHLHSPDWSRIISRTDKEGDFVTLGVTPHASLALGRDHVLTVGMDGFYKRMEQRQTVQAFVAGIDTPSESSVPIDAAESMMAGLFAQDEHRFNAHWLGVVGGRGDVVRLSFPEGHETSRSTDQSFTGNAGLVYQPSEDASISLNVGRAFRAPTLKEKFVEQAACQGVLCGRASVKPEKTWNFDFGVRGSLGKLSYELYDFLILADDFISLMPSVDAACDYEYTNVRRSLLYGGETRWQYVFSLPGQMDVEVWTSAAAVMGESLSKGEPLPAIPPLRLASGFRISQGSRRASSFYAEANVRYSLVQDRVVSTAEDSSESVTGAYAISNAGLGFRAPSTDLGVAIDTYLRVTNLANTGFRDHLSVVDGMGRNVKLGLGITYD